MHAYGCLQCILIEQLLNLGLKGDMESTTISVVSRTHPSLRSSTYSIASAQFCFLGEGITGLAMILAFSWLASRWHRDDLRIYIYIRSLLLVKFKL